MKIFTAQNITAAKLLTFLILVLITLFLTASQNPSSAMSPYTLDKNGCAYAIDDLIGKYSIKVGGVGLIDKNIGGGVHQGNFNINGINGSPYRVYLYWTLRKEPEDKTIQININNKGLRNVTANQSFGPAVLSGSGTTYWGYIADLTSTWAGDININANNSFTIRKNLGVSDVEFFGAGLLVIHNDPSLSHNQHIEVKCGFDASFYRNIGNQPNNTKWGEWSNVVCHKFPADPSGSRQIKYYAFMSGTKEKLATNYRPNALWYKTGITTSGNIPSNITNLNKSGGTPNTGLNTISGSVEFKDLFNALSGNEWDTIDSTKGTPVINIPSSHDYICFQTQSVDRPPILHPAIQHYGWGSSMQWSMSALSFSESGASTPTITPSPSPVITATPTLTSTPTPTPIVYHPWVNTVSGNTYSRTFNQTPLSVGQTITNTSATFDGIGAFLSTDLYLQPIGSSAPQQASARNAHKTNYTDANSQYKSGITWFAYFNQYLRNSLLDIVLNPLNNSVLCPTATCAIALERTSNFHPSPDLSDVAVHAFSGNLSLDVRFCNSKTIFLVDGNLTINPNLIAEGYENGCMFIVSGTTTILAGSGAGSTDFPANTAYDQVDGYFVTKSFQTMNDPSGDGLFVKGGVVETEDNPDPATLAMNLNRDLGIIRNRFSPSEIIEYDSRYLYIYGDLLTYVYGYNIRESQFIRTLE